MDRLFVVYKPTGISCNNYLTKLKRQYRVKKAGFSGTLDPFAKGCLVVAFGAYTRFFRFLQTAPKVYRATLWLGAQSDSLDIERVQTPVLVDECSVESVQEALHSLIGTLSMSAPKFSAKHVDGKRAYELAREGKEFELPVQTVQIYDAKLLHYRHPFVTFEATVQQGVYIRSLGEMVAKKLGCDGSLSALERISEGKFTFEEQRALDPLEFLCCVPNRYLGDFNDIVLGRKLVSENFEASEDGLYIVRNGQDAAIMSIENDKVEYMMGGIKTQCEQGGSNADFNS